VHPEVTTDGDVVACRGWTVRADDDGWQLSGPGDDVEAGEELDGLRALCVAHWSRHPDDARQAKVAGGDDAASAVLVRWGL
jgi:glycerol-1-phosphatase